MPPIMHPSTLRVAAPSSDMRAVYCSPLTTLTAVPNQEWPFCFISIRTSRPRGAELSLAQDTKPQRSGPQVRIETLAVPSAIFHSPSGFGGEETMAQAAAVARTVVAPVSNQVLMTNVSM